MTDHDPRSLRMQYLFRYLDDPARNTRVGLEVLQSAQARYQLWHYWRSATYWREFCVYCELTPEEINDNPRLIGAWPTPLAMSFYETYQAGPLNVEQRVLAERLAYAYVWDLVVRWSKEVQCDSDTSARVLARAVRPKK